MRQYFFDYYIDGVQEYADDPVVTKRFCGHSENEAIMDFACVMKSFLSLEPLEKVRVFRIRQYEEDNMFLSQEDFSGTEKGYLTLPEVLKRKEVF